MSSESGGGPHRVWGGRFGGSVDPEIDRFTRSFGFDHRLARCDLVGSLAHARMLWDCDVLDDNAARAILEGLADLLERVESGAIDVLGAEEDVHSWIERNLTERIGDDGRRLHTARSRNDQVGAAVRLFVRHRLVRIVRTAGELIDAFRLRAADHLETFLPGYTHLQRGQPVSLAHHLLAHVWSLEADVERFMGVHKEAGRSPLGACALAGTPHAISPERTQELLGFDATYPNSMYAVADRDYVVQASFAAALAMVHLSRWASEVVLWTSSEVGFARLTDSVSKGSSIMPQKRNPEPAEILRGKSGRVIGDLTAHLVQLKGLPLTYNSDLQEDKEALFDAVDTVEASARAARALLAGLEYQTEKMNAALHGGFITATDLADGLVARGVPFRTAHEQTGEAVRAAEAAGCELWELSLDALREHCPEADQEIFESLEPRGSVLSHSSPGGPAPARVREQLVALEEKASERETWLELHDQDPPILRAAREGRLLDADLLGASAR